MSGISRLTLLVPALPLIGAGAFLFLFPSQAVWIFPFLGFCFLLLDYLEQKEVGILYAFLISLIWVWVFSKQGEIPARVALGWELAALGGWAWGLSLFPRKKLEMEIQTQKDLDALESSMKYAQRDLEFYQKQEEEVRSEVAWHQRLIRHARQLSEAMSPQAIQSCLENILKEIFPQAMTRVAPNLPSNPMEEWAYQRGSSLLVEDLSRDGRFAPWKDIVPFRSVAFSPLKTFRQMVGWLKVESSQPTGLKPSDLRTLDLLAALGSLSLENSRLYEQISEMAVHDGLTQLYTHRFFQERLVEEILRAGRYGTPLSLVLLDLDHFKRYNDTWGHPAGDALLRRVAEILQGYIRDVDVVARYGGEEFAVILPGIAREYALDWSDQIRQAIERGTSQGLSGGAATASFGVASFPQDATTHSQLIRAADMRMYQAKSKGRNRVVG